MYIPSAVINFVLGVVTGWITLTVIAFLAASKEASRKEKQLQEFLEYLDDCDKKDEE